MCYAIPGKVVEINDKIVTVDYFDERKKARNDFYQDLAPGEYVYAQGGFVVQRIAEAEALNILQTWQELFVKLKEVDLRLTREPKNLHQIANATRQRYLGNSCCIHGIIEFSNYCRQNCLYCGIRKDNANLTRYRMSQEEIIQACGYAINELKFKALVLQSGEDLWYDQEKLFNIVGELMRKNPVLLILSIGERDIEVYKKLYQAGARGALLRFETSNPDLYEKYRPGHTLKERLALIKELQAIGYLIFTGFLSGLPGESEQDVLNDIELTHSLNPEMFSFGPFIPHPETPLKNALSPSLESTLNTIARARIFHPEARILVTTALETLDREEGARKGFLSGANSLMINLTPKKYQDLYQIYPQRAGTEKEAKDKIKEVLDLLTSIGRAPTDLGLPG
ncbi:MAG: [FeFe] hydrogenase H-cluster radical SAM maturase HydE [Candidatus Omnitrophota bacterium]|nr:[FeFe] hydrogenase H-cluster radical SAM maturase HydE [Candidatus Omnitrophota bacterium]